MKPIVLYYWLTPLFWLLDELAGVNIRTAALEGHPWWKASYYLFCMAIPIVSHYRSGWTADLGILETSTNVVLLVLGVLLPYYQFIDRAAVGDFPAEPPITMESMTNFILSAAVLALSLQVQTRWKTRKPFPRG